ncbi:MAG TPA: hypothetical protein VEW03_12075, partial [Longimicrobiaceae bacterium]|nr:hypothetical protein [Longimicrobiaceae bacterium]
MLVTKRLGANGSDTARFLASGPLISTAGWRSWVVSYETNLTLADSAALEAQSDSVWQHVRAVVTQRTDSTA